MSDAMFYQAIGSSIQVNKDKIEKLEKQNARLKKQKKDLQQENQQLKNDNAVMKANLIRVSNKELDLYKEVIEEVREYAKSHFKTMVADEEAQELLRILDKAKGNK